MHGRRVTPVRQQQQEPYTGFGEVSEGCFLVLKILVLLCLFGWLCLVCLCSSCLIFLSTRNGRCRQNNRMVRIDPNPLHVYEVVNNTATGAS